MVALPNQKDSPEKQNTDDKSSIAKGVIVGGVLLVAIMLAQASLAIVMGWVSTVHDGQIDLQRWLAIEVSVGAVASTVCGYVCRRIAKRFSGPCILAVLVFCIGLFEASVILQYTAGSNVKVSALLAVIAPFVSALGVLIGGWRPQWRLLTQPSKIRELRVKAVIQYCAPIVILATAAVLSLVALPSRSEAGASWVVASALTLDYVVTIPAFAYLFLVRTRRLPFIALFPIFAMGYAFAMATIPAEYNSVHDALKWIVIPVELAFVAYLVTLARKLYRKTNGSDADFASRLRSISRGALGKRIPADILTTEVSILYYAFSWAKSKQDEASSFTVYKDVGYLPVLVSLVTLFLVEIVALHLILMAHYPAWAWTATGLSIYGLIWVVGDFRAMVARPIQATATHLRLRVGIRWDADIAIDQIALVEANVTENQTLGRDVATLGMLGQRNLHISLKEPIEIIGMYGIRRRTKEIWLQVDRAGELCQLLRESGHQS
jgi:hypothetical protein